MTKQLQKKKAQPINHRFTNLREAFVSNGLLGQQPGTAVWTITGASGNGAAVIAPLGLTGAVLAGSTFAQSYGNLCAPSLRGLYNRAIDFQWYRITRAKFIFVGNQGTNVTGTICMSAYTDPIDTGIVTYPAYTSGPGTKVFDLATAGTKECSIPIPVDSSWKKVTSITTTPGNGFPLAGTNASFITVFNTVGDLACGAVAIQWSGAPTGNVGSLYIDYDVEFKNPVDSAVNN